MPIEITHSNVNHSVAYQIPSTNVFDWWDDYAPDKNWVDEFAGLILKLAPQKLDWEPITPKALIQHINKQIKVDKSNSLLPRIHAVLSHVYADSALPVIDANLLFFKTTRENQLTQDQAIVSELLPIVSLCEAGFLERLETIWSRWTTQDTILHLLVAMRHDIVRQIGMVMIRNDVKSQRIQSNIEIHELDCYFMAAESFGLGVEAVRAYTKTPQQKHLDAIEKNFSKYYNPISMIDSICNYMMSRCQDCLIPSVSSHDQTCIYLPDTLVRVVEYLNTILNTTHGIYDLFLVNDQSEPTGINWNFIRFYIHQNLMNLNIVLRPLFDEAKPLIKLSESELVFWLKQVASRENRILYLNTHPELIQHCMKDEDYRTWAMTLFKEDICIFSELQLSHLLFAAAKLGDISAAEKIKTYLTSSNYYTIFMTSVQNGYTPLKLAINNSRWALLTNHVKDFPECLFTVCCYTSSLDILEELIKTDRERLSVPHNNIYHQLVQSKLTNHISSWSRIKNISAFIFHQNQEHKTPLDLAVELRKWSMYVTLLTSAEFEPFPDSAPAVHLLRAVIDKQSTVVDLLIKRKALDCELAHCEGSGDTIVHIAIQQKNMELLGQLLAHSHCDRFFQTKNTKQITPLDLAAISKKWSMFNFILENYSGQKHLNDLGQTLLYINDDNYQALFDKQKALGTFSQPICFFEETKKNIAHYAVENDDSELLTQILNHPDRDVFFLSVDKKGNTPLVTAIISGKSRLIPLIDVVYPVWSHTKFQKHYFHIAKYCPDYFKQQLNGSSVAEFCMTLTNQNKIRAEYTQPVIELLTLYLNTNDSHLSLLIEAIIPSVLLCVNPSIDYKYQPDYSPLLCYLNLKITHTRPWFFSEPLEEHLIYKDNLRTIHLLALSLQIKYPAELPNLLTC